MLNLTRRVGECIYIGKDVFVRVSGISGGQVMLAIDAPKDIPVHREEIYWKIQEEKRLAAASERVKKFLDEATTILEKE